MYDTTNSEGIIKNLGGKRLSNGVIEIPVKNTIEFETILDKNGIKYNKNKILA